MAHHFLNAAIPDKRVADTLEFKTTATSFLTSSSEVSNPWVRLFLVYHAIECALKAYLASKNVPRSDTHDILVLAREAASHGLVLTTEDNLSLQTFGSVSKDGKQESRPSIALRYNILGGTTWELPDVLKRIAESINNQITP